MKNLIYIFLCGFLSIIVSCSDTAPSYEMVFIKGGEFRMGSDSPDSEKDEYPEHMEYVKDFFIGKYEISQRIWIKFMRKNPSCCVGKNNPVECVSYDDAMSFIHRLNRYTKKKYRLPTEIEWEYVAQGGINGKKLYSGSDTLSVVAWYVDNSDGTTHKIGEKKPNSLGIFDMTGNVSELCYDTYQGTDYSGNVIDTITNNIPQVIFRGGSCYSDSFHCRITNRMHCPVHTRNYSLGFRLAMDIE